MAQTEFTGYKMSAKYNTTKNLEGLRNIQIVETGKGPIPQLDVTVATDSAYTFLTDPLGGKGKVKAALTITMLASTASLADTATGGHAAVPFNTAQTWVVDQAVGVTTANHWTHASLQMTKRSTKIPFDGFATCTITAEGNALGVWSGPA